MFANIVIKESRGRNFRRLSNDKYKYVHVKDNSAEVHYECIACDYHSADLLELQGHITENHTVLQVQAKVTNVTNDEVDQILEEVDQGLDDAEELIPKDEESDNDITVDEFDVLSKAYNLMQEEKKWKLSTGKCVEDELYSFARQCTYDHPCLSFIIDPYDATYIQNGIFTQSELEEIKDYNAVAMDNLPKDLVDYLMLFDCHTSEDLRKACFENQKWYYPFNKTEHYCHDWIRRTIDMMIPEFEAGSLKKQHHENWYMVRIWSLIDRLFTDVEDLEAVRGESGSIATAARKNQDRVIPSMVKMKRKAMGRRADLILRKGSAEYGCAEAGAKDEGLWGTKKLLEKGMKAAKALKDMLNQLSDLVGNDEASVRQLCTIGYIISGMSLEVMIMDSPTGYCCRITRSQLFSIPTSAFQVKSKLLPLMSALIVTKLRVLKVIDIVENYGSSDVNFRNSLANAFKVGSLIPSSPERKTIMLPSCNITPTKRRRNSTS